MTIHVVTEVSRPGGRGNLATGLGSLYLDPQATGGSTLDDPIPLHEASGVGVLAIYIQVPVFRLGEILHLGADDRDQFGRKPDKWSVTLSEANDWEAAVELAREALAGDLSP